MLSRLILVMTLAAAPLAVASQEPQSPDVPVTSGAISQTATDTSLEPTFATDEQIGPVLANVAEPSEPLPQQSSALRTAQDSTAKAAKFLRNGGPSIWVIAALSVVTMALILWKIWRLALIGAWSEGKAGQAVELFETGDANAAIATIQRRRGIRSKIVEHAIRSIRTLPEDRAREDVSRVARREIAAAGSGLRALELIATIAPLLGLLGTVLGMIAAFQALQQSGNQADPALLAGGIWEALLTTAAGMAVAIPASAALTWFEAVIDRIRRDVEDAATRIFVSGKPDHLKLAAE